jgi:hypothetical protein
MNNKIPAKRPPRFWVFDFLTKAGFDRYIRKLLMSWPKIIWSDLNTQIRNSQNANRKISPWTFERKQLTTHVDKHTLRFTCLSLVNIHAKAFRPLVKTSCDDCWIIWTELQLSSERT